MNTVQLIILYGGFAILFIGAVEMMVNALACPDQRPNNRSIGCVLVGLVIFPIMVLPFLHKSNQLGVITEKPVSVEQGQYTNAFKQDHIVKLERNMIVKINIDEDNPFSEEPDVYYKLLDIKNFYVKVEQWSEEKEPLISSMKLELFMYIVETGEIVHDTD